MQLLNSLREFLIWAQPFALLFTFIGTLYTCYQIYRMKDRWRRVRIIAVDTQSGDRKFVAELPWQLATRAELQGLVANAARGQRLDFSQFEFDYRFRPEIEVRLPQQSFALVAGAAAAAADAGS